MLCRTLENWGTAPPLRKYPPYRLYSLFSNNINSQYTPLPFSKFYWRDASGICWWRAVTLFRVFGGCRMPRTALQSTLYFPPHTQT